MAWDADRGLACDDTLFYCEGRLVDGFGVFRDAVRSTIGWRDLRPWAEPHRAGPAHPWRGTPIAVPINVRVHRKHDDHRHRSAIAMITEIARWLPERYFHLCADGAYAIYRGVHAAPRHLLAWEVGARATKVADRDATRI
ncbi:hypothetical protein ACFTWF_34115 [Rhodococcus sp. NPDC056960]|uniref:hypothetical protein n=1 Tax=Rhodococcus TaxID=1827 RepID=UPI00363BCCA3